MITITLGIWIIPLIITILSICWALFYVDGGEGMLSGLANLLALIPALFISLIAWIIWGIFK